ncbi:MAG TPA: TIGR04283 family arsenosugar biosynthesis glycosyltransferase [Candidatus Binatia bacterium]|nr:TIGR04283 family arsenosugar biosynthesis glycosyltransferase [Candidatus Binatia bacterium]
MRISVIIPVLNEEKNIVATLQELERLNPDELIVVDGGSSDGTREVCQGFGVEFYATPRGRAQQMNFGAQQATGDVLLFLHADTRLPPFAFADIRSALEDRRVVGGRFDLQLDAVRPVLKLIGFMISLRSRISKVATGDQAIFVRREIFAELGGYPDIPLMEDVAFSRALKRRGVVACLHSRVVTSARRWEQEGVWSTVVKMWLLKSLYLAGISPVRLKRYYGDTR